ncbi:MAG: DUF362 domain-containing protein [bacterium]
MIKTARVYFIDLHSSARKNIFQKVASLLDIPDVKESIQWDDLLPIKLHFGERGGWAYIHPKFVACLVDKVKQFGGKPFLTDSGSVYIGSRSEAVSHLETAVSNGFAYSVVGAPIIIADGLRGEGGYKVAVNLKHYRQVEIASLIPAVRGMICLSHVKGHELTGFGGALKNMGMGLASRAGKFSMHSTVTPYINKGCRGCGRCITYCPGKALYLKDHRAWIDQEKCIGCAQCLVSCPSGNIRIRWDESIQNVQEKICEHVYGITRALHIPVVYINFVMNVTPDCDCYNFSDVPIVSNLGILASLDPVAIDQASVDLVNSSEGVKRSALKSGFRKGEDKFRGVHAKADWSIQLSYGEDIGLGTRTYELIPYEA